ncbi:hypothetical protein A2707_04425 [Candidatus Saccharibacteria bacterium RIFCSPHIGHO2_01_FULL_45_15]|nr:MAG: hypothetical protein A2707_04425 [Candidatus Saccharibacteria bacterium RIFCSPHIGHO2_01_FULL_45_15]OGL27182.1 MAG: hypothetical protein A3C39_01310 [Candidatus Saccharibacteria bacterium RIFCSPHIGHO2_02_FULL_46_12]OGL32775.1 MAG: hypothetical protein A3E76_05540 [Candidatus Saccharibacteria bacterium RIFCSPHIGHO2_12_FULL_44_22]
MKKLLLITMAFIGLVGIGSVATPVVSTTSAVSPVESIRQGTTDAGSTETGDDGFNRGLRNVVNVMMFLLGAIAVIMIVIGGIRYVTSNGDASSTKAAKDTILYSVIGLIVALIAYAIVSFVITQFSAR